jgi:hypothetical protein
MFKWSLAVGVILTNLITTAFAGTVSLVTSRSELRGDDSIYWGQLPGPTLTIFPTPVTVVSNGGIEAKLTTSVSTVFKDQQGSPWQGNFAPGDYLIGMGQLTPSVPIEIGFAHPVSGVGAQFGYDIISATPFPFIEALNLYDGAHNLLASFTVSGFMDNAADDSAAFIGAIDTAEEIASAEFFTPTMTGPFAGAFTINQVSLVDSVSEPGSFVLLAVALIGFGMVWRWTTPRRSLHRN